MDELQLLSPDTSSKALVNNMKTYQKVSKRLLAEVQPAFTRCFAVAESLRIDVTGRKQSGQGVSVSAEDMMQANLAADKGGPSAADSTAQTPDTTEAESTATDTNAAPGENAQLALPDSARQKILAAVDISNDLEMLAIVHNAKIELSHLLYLAADLNVRGALQFLSMPVPEDLKKKPIYLNEYKKKVAANGIQFGQTRDHLPD